MAGGLIDLVAYGIEDLYLTGDPQITFFKLLYRRHTNFAVESIAQNFSSNANFGESVACTIGRMGDLVGQIFLYVEIPMLPKFIDPITGEEDCIKKFAWVNNLGYALVQEVTIEIGGKLIDKQYGEWMYIWSQVTNRQNNALDKMIGNIPSIYDFSNGKQGCQLYIPLNFWFCKNNALALPIIALASTDIKINVTFRRLEECYRIGPTHSIEILEDIVPFKAGDYIEQTVRGQTIYGYVIDYDYLQKKLFYIKIQSPTSDKKTFESNQNRELNYTNTGQNILQHTRQFSSLFSNPIHPPGPNFNNNSNENIQYRIYNSINRMFCTPKPNSREMIESLALPNKLVLGKSFLYVNYVYLDSDERNKFMSTYHEYLIEQIQFNQELGIKSPHVKQTLALNHPCKAMYWVAQLGSLVGPGTINDLFNYTTSHIRLNSNQYYGSNLVESGTLLLNGIERFEKMDWQYFNYVEPYYHHYRGPSVGINAYSPSLHPEQHQPSSSINMSKIDNIEMLMHLNKIISPQNMCKIRHYTINYNVLRICFNLGGLVFS